jgi:hypothetical protein
MSSRGWPTEGPVAETVMISHSLSVSMNVMVTGLILVQLFRAGSLVLGSYQTQRRPSTYSKVAAVVTESAAPLAIFGVCYITVVAITYYRKPVILSQRGTLNGLAEVSWSLFYSFSVSSTASPLCLHFYGVWLNLFDPRHYHLRWSFFELLMANLGRTAMRAQDLPKSFPQPYNLREQILNQIMTLKQRVTIALHTRENIEISSPIRIR